MVTEIQAKCSKKQPIKNANSVIYCTRARTELDVLDKKAKTYYVPKQEYQTRLLQLRLLKFILEVTTSPDLLNY